MSIHAQLSPEAKARLEAQQRNSTILSGVIAMLLIAAICLLLGLFLLPSLIKETPTIVTYQATQTMDENPTPEKTKSTIQRKPTSPSSAMSRVIASSTSSPVSIPVPDIAVDTESVEFGDNENFGGGWGDSVDFAEGGGASFFNQSVNAQRIAYVIDFSKSMDGERDKLMRAELSKSIGGLGSGTKYQMVFFSGPAWVAGDKVEAEGGGGRNDSSTATVTDPQGKSYKWSGKGWHEWRPQGNRRPVEWIDRTDAAISKSLSDIKTTPLSGGTDWETPLEMVLNMEPSPQIVFFMTDGAMGEKNLTSLVRRVAASAKRRGTVINSVAMMEPKVADAMGELANRTGGKFTIVEKGGKVTEVNPEK